MKEDPRFLPVMPWLVRDLPYAPGTEHYAVDSFFYRLDGGFQDGERVRLMEWVAAKNLYRVRGSHGKETFVNLLQLDRTREVLTIHGWLHEAHPAALRELVTQLHYWPPPGSTTGPEMAGLGQWHIKRKVLLRNGGRLPEELERRAREAGLLERVEGEPLPSCMERE